MIEGTVAAWVEALTHNRVWDERRDAPRIRHAFKELATHGTRWPAPVHMTENLPPVETLLALPANPTDPAVAEANIERIRRMLNGTE